MLMASVIEEDLGTVLAQYSSGDVQRRQEGRGSVVGAGGTPQRAAGGNQAAEQGCSPGYT